MTGSLVNEMWGMRASQKENEKKNLRKWDVIENEIKKKKKKKVKRQKGKA